MIRSLMVKWLKRKKRCDEKNFAVIIFIIPIVCIFARLPVQKIIFDSKRSREDWSLGMKEIAFSLFRIFGHSIGRFINQYFFREGNKLYNDGLVFFQFLNQINFGIINVQKKLSITLENCCPKYGAIKSNKEKQCISKSNFSI